MNKRIVSVLLCVVLLLGMTIPVYAADDQENPVVAEIRISTLDEFLQFAEKCRLDSYSQNLLVSLESDIDLTGVQFEGVPIFSGTFRGNGHTIWGLLLENDGSDLGLFRYLTATALVEELHVSGEVAPGGSRTNIGGLVGKNAGTIRNCSFEGAVSGGDVAGGLVGQNAVTGVIDSCTVDGVIHGNHFIGGIAGENNGVIRDCVNHAEINTTAQQNSVEISDITMDTLTNSEAVNTVTDIGGIAGISTGVIRGCENRGDVGYQQMGYNIGGIAGTQSGYITDCTNYGQIQGRKEVGGIVGQMEPVALIEYSEDTLQILQDQLGTMSGLVNQASSNAQSNARQISGQIGVLQDQTQTAKEAVDALVPDVNNPSLPDLDALLAAQNTLSSTINSMPGTLNNIATATQNTVTGLTRDLQAVSNQISAMGQTINSASETLGGSITDISDQDTPELLTGKVELCVNYGTVLADLNAGGIVGAMAMENDLDILEDWEQNGESSLNFESEVRAVVRSCENRATVTGKKQQAGGIVGWQSLGLVKECTNTGTLDASNADYVGGISGLSTGFLRSNYAKCEINGSTYVGGIAGCATIATDCRSMTLIPEGSEKLGGILGGAEESNSEEEEPISGNFYFCVAEDRGGIDGVSYDGSAQPLELEAFLALENLPDLFRTVTVRFLFEDGTEAQIAVAPGGSLDTGLIPELPEKDGDMGRWEGLEQVDLTNILFDMTFEATYKAHKVTLQTEQTRDNGLPLLLVQGTFTEKSAVTVLESGEVPMLEEQELLMEVWRVKLTESQQIHTARLLLPEETDTENLKLLVSGEDGGWSAREFSVDESYIVFSWAQEDSEIALVTVPGSAWQWYAVGAAAVLVLALGVLLILRKKRKK